MYAKTYNRDRTPPVDDSMIQNLVFIIMQAVPIVQKNLMNFLYDVRPELGRGLAVGLQTANATLPTPVNILYYP